MKKIVFAILLTYTLNIVYSQTIASSSADTTWKKGGGVILNFNQIGLTNWAAGGENALSSILLTNLYANYHFGLTTWDNTLNLNYGIITANNYQSIRKNDDKIELNSKYGRSAFGKFYYSGLLNFISQFDEGYDYLVDPDALTPVSNLLAPGYLTIALGLDYKPNSKFSLFFSPATGKFTFVMDDSIANRTLDGLKGIYGNDIGQNFRAEFGASLVASLTTNITEDLSEIGKLTLFNNFTNPVAQDRANVDVSFTNTLNYKLSKYFTASLYLEILYDDDISISTYDENDIIIGSGPKTQVKEIFGIGFSYNFGGK